MTDTDYDYTLYEIERCDGMLVLIVTMNSTDSNNHNAILYVVVHYRIIYYLYVNVI